MLNEKEMQRRIDTAKKAGVPIVNYGIAIAQMHSILRRSLEPFPEILKILDKKKNPFSFLGGRNYIRLPLEGKLLYSKHFFKCASKDIFLCGVRDIEALVTFNFILDICSILEREIESED